MLQYFAQGALVSADSAASGHEVCGAWILLVEVATLDPAAPCWEFLQVSQGSDVVMTPVVTRLPSSLPPALVHVLPSALHSSLAAGTCYCLQVPGFVMRVLATL